MNNYFRSIKSKLSLYESLRSAPALLELAVWKFKITGINDQSNVRLKDNMKKNASQFGLKNAVLCWFTDYGNDNCSTRFSFLTDGSGGNGIVGDDDDDNNNGDSYDYNDIDDGYDPSFDSDDSEEDGEDEWSYQNQQWTWRILKR